MSKVELLEQIIEDFNKDALIRFYKLSSDKFRPVSEDFSDNLPKDDKRFENIEQIGRIEHEKKAQSIAFFISSVSGEISERDSKKKQYDIGKKILRDNYLDAGIFVFYGENNFRLSLIAASYSGPKRKFTTFKRYTYFVSPELTNKTFKDQLKKCDFSSVEKILESFSIEAVNKDFYTQIAKKYTDLVGGWLKTGSKKYEREGCLVWPDKSDEKRKEFAVRLIGRLVFCWFLKKKHSEPANVPLVPKDILSLEAAKNNDSYYLFVLEPLFFQVLNKKLNDRHKKYKTNGWDKIPFLNGGLFTPHSDDYYNPDDFQGISPRGDVKVPDEWLRELLEIFERYNFTIDENTPVDIEISIDPEMLGRIFENLLAMINPETGETARKSTGSYYTPRPIVEYMVDQSIKQYLLTQTNIPEENIDSLLDYSRDAADANLTDEQNDCVIEALDKLKVLDPACGSGAFPIGILQKILLILQKVDPDSTKWKTRLLAKIPNSTARKSIAEKLKSETWQYIHKLGVIQSSIYGVDIQPIAAEISKLRVFLSLIVDETVNDNKDNRGIEPLPNLKFKFVCGNSLIDKFMGRIIKTDSSVQTKSKKIIDKLTGLKADFFSAIDEKEKVELNLKILQGKLELAEQLLADLRDTSKFTDNLFGSEAQTEKQKKEKEKSIVKKLQAELLNKAIENTRIDIGNLIAKSEIELAEVEQLETKHFKESFIWKMDFAEIFAENNGFDIIIGNPPYIRVQNLSHDEIDIYKQLWSTAWKRIDICTLFFELACSILNSKGTGCYISSNQFLNTEYGRKSRDYFLSKAYFKRVVDFSDLPVFANQITYVSIFIFQKHIAKQIKYSKVDSLPFVSDSIGFYDIPIEVLDSDSWNLCNPKIKLFINKLSCTFSRLDSVAKSWAGIITGKDSVLLFKINDPILNGFEKDMLLPVLRAESCSRYCYAKPTRTTIYPYRLEGSRTQIVTEKELKKHKFVYSHLLQNKAELLSRKDSRKTMGEKKHWYGLIRHGNLNVFAQPKIVTPGEVKNNCFALDITKSAFSCARVFAITMTDSSVDLLFLLGILNSKLIEFYLHHTAAIKAGGYFSYSSTVLDSIPIPNPNKQNDIATHVERILSIKESGENNNTETLEEEINQIVYNLYGLTKEEIAIIEGR